MAERQVNGVLLPDAEPQANGCNGRGLVSEQLSQMAAVLCYQSFSQWQHDRAQWIGSRRSEVATSLEIQTAGLQSEPAIF